MSQRVSQDTKTVELVGFVKKSKHASFPMHTVIFLDVTSLICRLSIAFLQEEHDPVKAVQRTQEFNWTTAKLRNLTESSLQGQNTCLTHHKQFLGKTADAPHDGQFYYQDVKLRK